MAELTPMMQQYQSIKRKYPDTILFFRLGDFYEMFNEDAQLAARVLDLALTSRNKGGGEKAPMAGVPAHSAASYIAGLIEKDYKVAICEQLEDAANADGLVERDVIRVITPGTVIESELLSDKENNFLASAVFNNNMFGFAYIDISTGEFYLTEFSASKQEKIWDEINRIQPREIIIDSFFKDNEYYKMARKQHKFVVNEARDINPNRAYSELVEHFKTNSLSGYGCEDKKAGILAAGQILFFLRETQKRTLLHINTLQTYNLNDYMVLDTATRRNLELTTTIRDNKRKGSLLNILDRTVTSMGGRLIKKWINQPLKNRNDINHRLEAVTEMVENYTLLNELRQNIDGIYDLERIMGKITYESANARDLDSLRYSLNKLPSFKDNLDQLTSGLFTELKNDFDSLTDLTDLLEQAIQEEPPVSVREGGLIRDGYNEELDELRESVTVGKDWITGLQKKERKRTGISSLKVGFNKVFGYYIEVTNSNLDKVPEDYTRKQTLSNSERYIIPELKEKEALVLGAEEKINDLEYKLFVDVRSEIGQNVDRIKKTATIISITDVLFSLALTAIEKQFNRPQITDDDLIEITGGRHPVVEDMQEQTFVPNDTYLDYDKNRFILITGPNMSGKSTYMRQVALIVLLAQMGSFIPADTAQIGIVDRIFTRVGASDDLTTGQSTFMVEMNEVANIVHNATHSSLIILDEVGRGTSTYDGLSIAWAVTEYIHDRNTIGARTLFATHYHELTKLEEKLEGLKNYNVLVEEDEKGVHFLHKIVPGSADQSYGIEVARLAGLPDKILINAQRILQQLEAGTGENNENNYPENKIEEDSQLPLFKTEHPVLKKVMQTDLLNMTPMEAMNFLYQIKKEIDEGEERNV